MGNICACQDFLTAASILAERGEQMLFTLLNTHSKACLFVGSSSSASQIPTSLLTWAHYSCDFFLVFQALGLLWGTGRCSETGADWRAPAMVGELFCPIVPCQALDSPVLVGLDAPCARVLAHVPTNYCSPSAFRAGVRPGHR